MSAIVETWRRHILRVSSASSNSSVIDVQHCYSILALHLYEWHNGYKISSPCISSDTAHKRPASNLSCVQLFPFRPLGIPSKGRSSSAPSSRLIICICICACDCDRRSVAVIQQTSCLRRITSLPSHGDTTPNRAKARGGVRRFRMLTAAFNNVWALWGRIVPTKTLPRDTSTDCNFISSKKSTPL